MIPRFFQQGICTFFCNMLCLLTPAVPSVHYKDKSEVKDSKFLKNPILAVTFFFSFVKFSYPSSVGILTFNFLPPVFQTRFYMQQLIVAKTPAVLQNPCFAAQRKKVVPYFSGMT